MAATLVAFAMLTGSGGHVAYADDEELAAAAEETIAAETQLSETQLAVEQTAAEYNTAAETLSRLEDEITQNESRLSQLNTQVADQQEKADAAVVAMYKSQGIESNMWMFLLTSSSISDFIDRAEYLMRIQDNRLAELASLTSMRTEAEQLATQLEGERSQAAETKAQAESALAEAQEARAQAQARAEAAAEAEAEAAAKAQAEAEAAAAAAAEEESSDDSDDGSTGSTPTTDGTDPSDDGGIQEGDELTPPDSDEADWTQDKTTFVEEWGARIDAYLSGTPLSGQGNTFASAAWDYGVDPRWSPAISYAESSCGAYCFLSHNAWGWGSCSWDTWEEAIDDHVAGLSRGYGYTITVDAAKKYCPPNWAHWYATVSEQMERI